VLPVSETPLVEMPSAALAAHEVEPDPPARPPAHLRLLAVVRTIIHADSDTARQALFAHVVQSHATVRLVYRLHQRLAGTRAAALLVSCYGLAALLRIARIGEPGARVLVVAGHENARREVGRVMSWIGVSQCGWVRTRTSAALGGSIRAWAARKDLARALRLVRAIDTRYGFLVSCRAAAAIAWYARAKAILRAERPGAVLVSSDANPEEAGFVGAARALGIPQVFVSHAYPTAFSPPLDFSLSILEGEAAVEAHRLKGPIRGDVLLAGIDGASAPLDVRRFDRPDPVIGIFPPKALSWQTLAAIIDECRQHFQAKQVVIRWHPSMLEPPRLGQVLADRARVVESDRNASLPEVAALCDWIVAAANSNVHLPVLKLGIPTVVVKGLGLYPESRADLYGFVANGIVFPPVAHLRDVRAEALRAFFTDDWAARFARYDASYLRSRSEIGGEARRAILALARPTGSTRA
jgi:hypothetical protein